MFQFGRRETAEVVVRWLFLDVSQVRVHFNKLIRECLPHYRFLTYLRAILDSTDTNVFNRMFSFVIGRSFDHIFEFQIRTHCLLFIRPLDLNHPQHWSANMAVGRGFFDQYSVFCVFGSVVGCVVVPLITQVRTYDHVNNNCMHPQAFLTLYSGLKCSWLFPLGLIHVWRKSSLSKIPCF